MIRMSQPSSSRKMPFFVLTLDAGYFDGSSRGGSSKHFNFGMDGSGRLRVFRAPKFAGRPANYVFKHRALGTSVGSWASLFHGFGSEKLEISDCALLIMP